MTDSQTYIRETAQLLRERSRELERELVQPEHLRGCECAIWENHDGRCSGIDCDCH